MQYVQLLQRAARDFIRNLSLLGVLVIGFLVTALLGLLFFLLDNSILLTVHPELAHMQNPAALLDQLTFGTITLLLALLFVQSVIVLLADSFFRAGFYGMIKNLYHDGSTSIREFTPEAKQFFLPMFAFQFIRYAILFLVGIPFLLALLPFLATGENLVLLGVMFSLSLVFVLIVSFFLMFGEILVVAEKEPAVGAIRGSIKRVRTHVKKALFLGGTVLILFLLFSALEMLISAPLGKFCETTQQASWCVSLDIIGLFFKLFSLCISAIIGVFLFRGYKQLRKK